LIAVIDDTADPSRPQTGRARPSRGARIVAVAAVGLAAALLLAVKPFAAPAATGGPTFVQQVAKRAAAASVTLQPSAAVTAGNRLIVEAAIWSSSNATASAVTDSAGNAYTELTHFTASDHTELSVWSAPITAGGGTKPTITVKATATADIGAAALEYSGLSTAAGAAAADQISHATATSGSGATNVSAGPTSPTTASGELALGFYADSGFGNALAGDPTYTVRTNVSPESDMEYLVQEQVLPGTGATPNPTTTTGPKTPWLAATVVFKSAAPAPPPTAPDTPSAPSATAGDGQATVSWTAPSNGGSPITGYTVTPYTGSAALPATTVPGTSTGTTIMGLTNGTAYTFTVSATNAIGTSAPSAASNEVTPSHLIAATPAFVQQVSKRALSTSLALQPSGAIAAGDRMIVETGIWSAANATAASVTDSAGNSYTELTHFTASDHTELSVWSAPITAGGGTKPTITVKASGSADIGAVALEYSGLSTLSGTSVLDQVKTGTGTTGGAGGTVSSGATAASGAANELALGVYADSGFGNALSGDATYSTRANVSPTSDMEMLVQDKVLPSSGSTANPTTKTGANTPWLAATLLLKTASSATPTAPAAPTAVMAVAGNAQATVSWTAPSDGGSPITGYTVTPYLGTTALAPTSVDGGTTSTTITGLTNGSAYTFTVSATNAIGTGSPSLASNAVTPSNTPTGQWGSLMTWPIVAVHLIELKTGNFLAFDGWQQPQPTFVWNAVSQTFPTTLNAPGSIFCAGNALLPDGRVITVGGDGMFTTGQLGLADTAIFDPASNTWTKMADMNKPRWYPSLTELPDGRYVAISGNSTNSTTWADTPEVYDPAANKWTLLTGISTPQVHEEEYPFSYLIPNGKIFTIGPSEDNSFELDVDNRTWTPVGGASGVVNGSSVMYRPGKVLYSGGAPSIDKATSAQATSAVIDLTAGTPSWRSVSPMNHARIYHTLTMLADGTVLAVGGENSSDQSIVTTGVMPAEIWDPATEKWTEVAPMAAARNYHSTAALLPDGRVLVAGGGHYQDGTGPGQYSAQIYSPPYLFNGARPTIAGAPDATTYGSDIAISTPDAASIKSVNLVSLAADTHQSDMDQHFVPLSFTAGSGSLTVHGPANASIAPPGNYMVFIVNDKGVPSVASMIHVAPALTAPAAPAAPSALAGDGQATVSWTAPADGGSPITGYTVTPYIGSTAQPATTAPGTATSATISGLTNDTSYTFTVSATNAIGTGSESPASNAVTPTHGSATPPAFVQQVSKRAATTSLTLQPTSAISTGNRLIVETGIWSAANATASAVTDSAGNVYTELTHFTASDHTELSVWSAPITAGGGTTPTITVKATGSADIGAAALEYSGLSTATGTGVVDQLKTATGTTGAAGKVSSGATAGSGAANELALGVYADSGFGDTLGGDPTYSTRTNVSPTGDMELLVQDRVLATAGATANPTVSTGANTPWLAATLVLEAATPPAPLAMAQSVSSSAPAKLVYAFPQIAAAPSIRGVESLLYCPLLNATGVNGKIALAGGGRRPPAGTAARIRAVHRARERALRAARVKARHRRRHRSSRQ
jgi:Domain of unknown function (DUF1929)/Fibronectin type III domain/Glyoxal oxidase N-terminus